MPSYLPKPTRQNYFVLLTTSGHYVHKWWRRGGEEVSIGATLTRSILKALPITKKDYTAFLKGHIEAKLMLVAVMYTPIEIQG